MAASLLLEDRVHPDTQAVLLLCAVFTNKGNAADAKPLTVSEYNQVASWLKQQGRRPGDLLGELAVPDNVDGLRLPRANRLRDLLARGVQMAAALERWHRLGLWVLSRSDAAYPDRLKRVLRATAPPLLYGAGDLALLNAGGLAVVGSRDVDEEGLDFTRRVAERCAVAGVPIVSGGARGVDQAAVSAALEADGNAIAVLAERLDRAATARDTKKHLRDGCLALVSPYEPEATFSVGRAMGRNKHVYALSDAGLVVRFTTDEGGTWAGAVEQLKRNRSGGACIPVFVRAERNPAGGCEQLFRDGAVSFPEPAFWEQDVRAVLSGRGMQDEKVHPPGDESRTVEPLDPEQSFPREQNQTDQAATPAPDARPELSGVPDLTGSECYRRCLPLILACLADEPNEKALTQRLQLVPTQVKAWLEQGIAEGKIGKKKKGRGAVYFAIDGQADRKERNDDAA